MSAGSEGIAAVVSPETTEQPAAAQDGQDIVIAVEAPQPFLDVKDESGNVLWGMYRDGSETGNRVAAANELTRNVTDVSQALLAATLLMAR